MILIAILVILVCAITMIVIVDGNRFVTRQYTVYSEKIDKEYTIALLADMHNKQYGKDNYKLIGAIREMNPDFITCVGDMLTARPGKDTDKALSLFSYLKEFPVYYSLGNHEFRMKIYTEDYGDAYEAYVRKLTEMGVKVLENDCADIPDSSIRIQGLMIGREYYKRFEHISMDVEYIRSLTGKKDDSKYEILLAHNPEYFPSYAEAKADLILSGHVHGGIMRLPFIGGVISPKLKLFPRFDGGIFHHEMCQMILSRGLGAHTIPVRVFNPGELVQITLKPCQNDQKLVK